VRGGSRASALALLLATARTADAQPAVTSLIEAQSGNIPFVEPTNRTDLYGQFQLEYGFASGRAGLRFEQNRNSEDQFDYGAVTQRWAEWSDERLRVRVGNFYTILGRGLIHRSFELPAVVLDQPGVRSRYGPSRDVDGVLVEGAWGPAAGRLLGGTPNSGQYSAAPENELFGLDRYQGTVTGGQLATEIWRHARVGAAYLRTSNGLGTGREFGSGFVELDPLRLAGLTAAALPIYLEYAQADRTFGDWWRFRTGARDTFALYAGANLLAGDFTLAAEWKDYREFRLGINDPPSLVREHGQPLLNRGTHVLDAVRERGFQLEGSWTLPRRGTATVNLSRSDARGDRFDERFVELHVAPEDARVWEATAFWDEGKDLSSSISERRVFGAGGTVRFRDRWAVGVDLERQDATRQFVAIPSVSFNDQYASLTVSRASIGSVSAIRERSTDPEQEDPARAIGDAIDPRVFWAGVLQATISPHHEVSLLVGERRGGRACTAGTCYEVQPFKGAELRLVTRF
jgi:uncharacterized protein DUF6029